LHGVVFAKFLHVTTRSAKRVLAVVILSICLSREWLQIDTDLLLIITSTDDELSGGTNIDDLERPCTPKIGVSSELFAISGCDAQLKSDFSPKLLEMDQDNLRTKLH